MTHVEMVETVTRTLRTAPRVQESGRADTVPSEARMRRRYRRILRFAARQLVLLWWFELVLPRIGLERITLRTRSARMRRLARRFHVVAVELGGLMIKVGQFLSSRLDVLPPEITTELEGLQDEVPPVPFPAIRALAEAELHAPLLPTFAAIDEVPVAAASLGQAHRARLGAMDAAETGLSDVVVKVQRPGIDQIVDADLAALRRIGGWLSHVRLVSSRVDMPALVEEFAITSREEVDYLHEAGNAERFRTDFAGDARVRVPEIAWELTTRKVLTLQDVTAIKISDTDSLLKAGIDPKRVASVFAAVMFDQIFSRGFFHADPHPGNVFVTPLPDRVGDVDADPWTLTFIDFGMMGEIPADTRTGLRKLLIAAAGQNGRGLVQAMRDLGVLLPSADTAELERALTALFARFGGMGAAELRGIAPSEVRDFSAQFGETIRSLPFQLPEHFLLVARAVSLTSGVCSALDPEFNVWDSIEPYASQLLREERGNVVQDFAQQAFATVRTALRLPGRLDELVTRLDDGSAAVSSPALERRVARLERVSRRLVSALLFGALLAAGAILVGHAPLAGTIMMIASVVPLLHALLSGRRAF